MTRSLLAGVSGIDLPSGHKGTKALEPCQLVFNIHISAQQQKNNTQAILMEIVCHLWR
jgi:hypothetical protein